VACGAPALDADLRERYAAADADSALAAGALIDVARLMSGTHVPDPTPADFDARFRESRIAGLAAINSNTFWSIAILLLVFVAWDAYADPAHWRSAFQVRLLGAALVVATGLFQKRPGNSRWMPTMAKVRLVTAVVTAALAASMLDRGYGFAMAGVVAILLTGPYIALDVRDLLAMNIAALLALAVVMVAVSLEPFEIIGTVVFVLLAVAVSMLLGRVLEASHRRAFALELELLRDARTDALTGLDNRRAMQERGPLELMRASRAGVPVSLILCDIDHFKTINDRYGHEAGDGVLNSVASTLRAALRATDLLSRWGGEEFLAVLLDTDARRAAEVAERMRAGVAATPLGAIAERATISIGVATRQDVDEVATTWEALLHEADTHLYRAKSAGRNRVISQQSSVA
jgi:diguanylate cyclase (GGDEF)-like protein